MEHAQQLRLLAIVELSDLVEEHRPLGGQLEAARAALERAGEGAPLVAEELALDQRRRERRAVDVHERALRPWRAGVQRARGGALAGAGLAREQHRRPQRRHAADLRAQPAHGAALADQLATQLGVARFAHRASAVRLAPIARDAA